MAERPIANALTCELEPVVAENLERHLQTATLWYAHDYVPFDQGENFPLLGGRAWSPSDSTLPQIITHACEVLLLDKDILYGYHRELVNHFILEDKWGRWIGRWTAEEHLHAIVLREYLFATRAVDPDANEQARMSHMSAGYHPHETTQLELLAFMAFFERARALYCHNLANLTQEPLLQSLLHRIGNDEQRHELFFANLVEHCLATHCQDTLNAIATQAHQLRIIGADNLCYQDRLESIAQAGIFGPAQLHQVITERLHAWGIPDQPAMKQLL